MPYASRIFSVARCLPDEPLFVIGDVHGEIDRLREALNLAHDLLKAGSVARVVFLGDLIDRGPDSLGCLHLAQRFVLEHPSVLLAGNHEQLALCALFPQDPGMAEIAAFSWARNGGLWAFNCDKDVSRLFAEPPFRLTDWRSHYVTGNVILVHAGVPPGASAPQLSKFLAAPLLDLPRVSGEDHAHWAWIRHTFLIEDPLPGHFVIHGHTRRDFTGKPRAGRLNLDGTSRLHARVAAARVTRGAVEVYQFSDAPAS